ncbi:MAG: LamG-like jellyroll fold domain-containing protein [Bacteroidota bacterium]
MAWEKCCLTLAGMRSFRELHELLRGGGWIDIDLSQKEWGAVYNADTMGLDPFNEYCSAIDRHGVRPDFLVRAQERWEHSRADATLPGVILLDEGLQQGSHPGIVLHIELSAKNSVKTRVHFRNALDEKNTTTIRQLAAAATAATEIVADHFRCPVPAKEWTVGFHEFEAAFAGESMGLSVALSMAYTLQKDFNKPLRWELQPRLVCTGGLEQDGSLKELPSAVLSSKILTAFFSTADALVLPAQHVEYARTFLIDLQQRYPSRKFELFGVSSLNDCVFTPGIIRADYRTIYDRSQEFIRTHSILLLIVLLAIFAATGGYFFWKSLYGYPDLEYAMGKRIEENSLVYNPRREADWQFRDFDRILPPLIPFGDLEIGADATRNIFIWNMTPTALEVALGLEGPQADQWYISWNGGLQTVNATDSLRVTIKYVPDHPSESHRARLTVRDPVNGKLLTQLDLTGAAGPPLPAGYALELDGIDDMLYFGELAIAFARDEATIEFWLRLDEDTACILSNNRNIPQGPALQNMVISHQNDMLSLDVGNNRSVIPLGARAFAKDGKWHHLALSFSREAQRIEFSLDGTVLLERREEFIIEGVSLPHVAFGVYHNGESVQNFLKGALDEIRVWDHALPADSIRMRMHRRVNGLSPGLLGYWDFDVIGEVSAYNANERTQDGQLKGRPAYGRSSVYLETDGDDLRLVAGPGSSGGAGGAAAIELQNCRWLQCGSNPIAASLQRSYAIRFRREAGDVERILTIMNQDAYFTLLADRIQLAGSIPKALPTRSGWNTFVGRIDEKQEMEVFINGALTCTITDDFLRRGPSYRYEGLEIGIFHDKYNNFGPKYYDGGIFEHHMKKAVTDFRVWNRRISDEAIAAYERGAPTPDGLVAHWPLTSLPDNNNNYTDAINGHLLHLWRYRGWE